MNLLRKICNDATCCGTALPRERRPEKEFGRLFAKVSYNEPLDIHFARALSGRNIVDVAARTVIYDITAYASTSCNICTAFYSQDLLLCTKKLPGIT